jgi:hypothetical protein
LASRLFLVIFSHYEIINIKRGGLDMSKFKIKDNRTFKQRAVDFGLSAMFWKGRKKGMIHTRDITLDDLREVFFPKDFNEKYGYLGYIYISESNEVGEVIKPLILAMDKKAKPKWCPRWFLRLLDLFGNDKSIVRVRNFRLSNLFRKLTKGYRFIDWKTKWDWYDLRISIYGCKELQDMADQIERDYYEKGKREEALIELTNINYENTDTTT